MAKHQSGVKRTALERKARGSLPNPVIKALFVEAATWLEQNELAKAEQALDRHLALAPHSWPGLCLKAMLAGQTQRYALAEQIWCALLKSRPDYADGHCQLGLVCEAMGRLGESEGHFQRALVLDPACHTAHAGLGAVYRKQGLYDAALQAYRQAQQIHPQDAQTLFGVGTVLQAMGDIGEAVAAYRQVLGLDPQHTLAASNLLFCQHFLADVDAAHRFATAKTLGPVFARQTPVRLAPHPQPDPERPLRIGVVSADLRRHPVAYFLETVLAALSNMRSQWIAFSNTSQSDEWTARLRPFFAAWHPIEHLSDAAAAQCVVDEKIDILLDLSGHTAGNRLAVFAASCAPIQLSWLGYFSTTGLPAMDYVLADTHNVPETEAQWFTEKIWRLPQTRLCFSPPVRAPDVSAPPVLAGRPFTFGSFQELAKINNSVLKTWARILSALPYARLRVQSVRLGYPDVMAAFAQHLRDAGLSDAQFQLFGPATRDNYLAAYADVDLVLDTFPYPGGTTTVEALWMGVPTLTLATPGMLGRQGAGLLANAGLPDWICSNTDTYVAQAVAWASPEGERRQQLSDLRAQLRPQLLASPLMDARQFAVDLDGALRGMWRVWCAKER